MPASAFRRLLSVLVLGTLGALASFGAPQPSYVRLSGGVAGYDFGDIALEYGLRLHAYQGKYEFHRGQNKIVFSPPRKEFLFNGIKIVPGYAPVTCNSTPPTSGFSKVVGRWLKENESFPAVAVSRSDWQSTLRPLLSPGQVPTHKIARITLDAGHGGADTGARGRKSMEKNLTLRITLRVAEILRACGYKVSLTRKDDSTVRLEQRPQLQRRHRSDLFVSIHVNATDNRSVTGIETFALTPADAPSSHGKKELVRHPANCRDANNLLLAYCLQRAMIKRTGAADRGVKRARFAVLRDIAAPGALVEVGFISNEHEEDLLNRKEYTEKIARAIAEGIISYHRLLKR